MEKNHGEWFVFHIFLYVKIARGPWQILRSVNPQAKMISGALVKGHCIKNAHLGNMRL
jgi:hypothetical protein